jgi:multisubunit Na+/H+ antiporter MnhB subunit
MGDAVVMAVHIGMFVVAVAVAALGLYALVLGRVPSQWRGRRVRRPRLWGAGGVLVVASWRIHSLPLLAVGAVLVALAYSPRTSRR